MMNVKSAFWLDFPPLVEAGNPPGFFTKEAISGLKGFDNGSPIRRALIAK